MKVIDLLNKIANGEKPTFEYRYVKYEYNDKYDSYMCGEGQFGILGGYSLENILNDEIEIIEENKIPEKIEVYEDSEGHYFIDKHCHKIYITCDEINFMVEEFNDLLDYLKSKGE